MADIDDDTGVVSAVDDSLTDDQQKEAEHVKALQKEFADARKFDSEARKQFASDRGYAAGKKLKNWASDANLIGTFIDILVSFLYARDPDVAAQAARNVGGVEKDNVDFAETAGIIVPRLWKKARLKKAARKMARSALSVGSGWLKVVMTHETRIDPQVRQRLNELDDNIARLKAMQELVNDPESELDDDELTVKLEDLKRLRDSVSNSVEAIKHTGLAIDYVQAEHMQTSLDVADITDYLDADWNADEMYVPVSSLTTRFKALTQADIKKATTYTQVKPQKRDPNDIMSPESGDMGSRYVKNANSGGSDGVAFARIVELWDRRDNHIKTFVEGIPKWAVKPYPPNYATTRFFPYFNLALFEVDGERHPQSLPQRLQKLQDEYSSKRSNGRLAAERSVPGTIFDNTGLTDADARKIEASVSMEMIGINPMKGDDLRKLFAAKPVPTVDPLIFDTRPTIADMERLSGVQEALSSTITTQKTATEAKIQDIGFNSRSGADRDTLEDVLNELAEYTLELAIQGISVEQAQRLAGAKAFWPAGMAADDIITLAEIEVKAGTTGKPDDDALRQSWSILLPLVQAIMREIQQAQVIGNLPMAVALRNLLEETFRRLDERIDVDSFIPAGEMANLEPVLAELTGGGGAANPTKPKQTSAEANTLV